ncbi:MAG: sensor domain-containing protein [Rhodospirillaceae bacterium]
MLGFSVAFLSATKTALAHQSGGSDGFLLHDYGAETAIILGVALAGFITAYAMAQFANRKLLQSRKERDQLLEGLGDGVYGTDRQGICIFINPTALEILGLRQEDVLGKPSHQTFHHHHPDGRDYPDHDCAIHKTLRDGKRRRDQTHFVTSDGRFVPVSLIASPMFRGPELVGSVVAFRDISETLKREEDIRLAAVAFETNEAIVITSADNKIMKVNRAFTTVTGYEPEEVIGQNPSMLSSGMHEQAFYDDMWAALQDEGSWQGEIWNRRKDGSMYPEYLTISTVRDQSGAISNYVATFVDITERKKAERAIHDLAFYDPLTRLPNRSLLIERIRQARATSERSRSFCAVMMLDLDHFKVLNDTRGHFAGDAFLEVTADRLRHCLRAGDTAARLGGDEFVILLEGIGDTPQAAMVHSRFVGDKILSAITDPFEHEEGPFHGSGSLGITLFRGEDQSVEDVLKQADLALYRAKEQGRACLCFFETDMQAKMQQQAALEAELRKAITNGELELYYQPQVTSDGMLAGAEALLRWNHPSKTVFTPDKFILAAERSHLIIPIGHQVMEDACKTLARWSTLPGFERLSIAVNVSALQFREPTFVSAVAHLIERHAIRPNHLKLELTESMLVEDTDSVIETMSQLRALGVELSIDDFGTGYSSLNYLKRLPIDQVKIDQSFVRDMVSDDNNAAIVRMVILLGQTFGLNVIAEGVETDAQRDFLKQEGAHAFQGWLYGRPVPIARFERDLREGHLPASYPVQATADEPA